jgi:sialic acid synthase SpsE
MTTESRSLEIIAELHPQHGGDLGVLREMIRRAARSGATAAKIQLYDAPALLGSHDWDYLQISRPQAEQIAAWCEEERIEFMASVFDEQRLDWCEKLGVRRHKIASRTVADNPALCRAILSVGKETLVSLGRWSESRKPFPDFPRALYLHCIAKYPALLEDLKGFPADFAAEGLGGYSDHTVGLDAPLLAIARGAWLIEKHFTFNKAIHRPTERAHVCSMTPDELAELRRVGTGLLNAYRAATHA